MLVNCFLYLVAMYILAKMMHGNGVPACRGRPDGAIVVSCRPAGAARRGSEVQDSTQGEASMKKPIALLCCAVLAAPVLAQDKGKKFKSSCLKG